MLGGTRRKNRSRRNRNSHFLLPGRRDIAAAHTAGYFERFSPYLRSIGRQVPFTSKKKKNKKKGVSRVLKKGGQQNRAFPGFWPNPIKKLHAQAPTPNSMKVCFLLQTFSVRIFFFTTCDTRTHPQERGIYHKRHPFFDFFLLAQGALSLSRPSPFSEHEFSCVGPAAIVSVAEYAACQFQAAVEVPRSVCTKGVPCCTPATYSAIRMQADGSVSVVCCWAKKNQEGERERHPRPSLPAMNPLLSKRLYPSFVFFLPS